MLDVRERLARHLYPSGLALAPMPIPVARLTHAAGVQWVLGNSQIVVTIGSNPPQTLDASGSVQDLLNDLLDLGVTTTFTNPQLLAVPASALVWGNGSDANSASAALSLFSSSLWVLLDAYGVELNEAERNLIEALDQLYMDTADGEILDVWGGYFGVPRKSGEQDEDYYPRIVREVLRPRGNRFAIEQAIFDDTGLYVSLREPMKEIFRLSVSGLSGGDHLQDGHFYTWNVFQPIYISPLSVSDRARVLAIIERNRPAGCLIVGADAQPPTGYAQATFAWRLSSQPMLVNDMGNMAYEAGLLSATLYLSNQRELVNTTFEWTQSGMVAVLDGTDQPLDLFSQRLWDGGIWDSSVWSTPSVSSVVTRNPV